MFLKNFFLAFAHVFINIIPLINYQNPLYVMWDILMFLMSLLGCLYLPFQMAFLPRSLAQSDTRYLIQTFYLYTFVINSVIQMNLSYIDDDCTFIVIKADIFKNYLKRNLIPDILLIASLAIFQNYYRATTYSIRISLFFWRIIYRNSSISRFLDSYFYTDYGKAVRNLCVLFLKIQFCCHIFSCYFYLLGERSTESDGKSWITFNHDKMEDTITSKYINSFYFAVVTMSTIGYGDIAPITDSEKLFMIFMSLFASMLFGYTINSLASIFSQYDKKQLAYNQKYQELNRYFRDHDIDTSLQNRSKKYLEFMEKEGIRNDQSGQCLEYLSPFLKEEILQKVKKMKINSTSFVIECFFTDLKEQIFAPDEPILIGQTRSQPALYFIHRGQVEVFIQVGEQFGENIRPIGFKKQGEVFGLREFFLNSEDPSISVRSKGICVIHYINLSDFQRHLIEFPGDREIFMNIRDDAIFNQNLKLINEGCLSCQLYTHETLNCPRLDYYGRKHHIIEKFERKLQNFRKNYQRKPRNKCCALKLKQKLVERLEKFQQQNLFDLILFENDHISNVEYDDYEEDMSRIGSIREEKESILDQISQGTDSQESHLSVSSFKNNSSIKLAGKMRSMPEIRDALVNQQNEPGNREEQKEFKEKSNNDQKSGSQAKRKNSNSCSIEVDEQAEFKQQINQIKSEQTISNEPPKSSPKKQEPNNNSPTLEVPDRHRTIMRRTSTQRFTLMKQISMRADDSNNPSEKLTFQKWKNFSNYQPYSNISYIIKLLKPKQLTKHQQLIMKSPLLASPKNNPSNGGQRRSTLLMKFSPMRNVAPPTDLNNLDEILEKSQK